MIEFSFEWRLAGRPTASPEPKFYGDIMAIGSLAPRLKAVTKVLMDLCQQSGAAGIVKEGVERVSTTLGVELQVKLDAVMNQQMDYAGVRWTHQINDDGIVEILLEVTNRGSALTGQAILRSRA